MKQVRQPSLWSRLSLLFCLGCFLSLTQCTSSGRPIETIELSSAQFELPSKDFAKAGFFAASVDKIGSILGDDSGLFHLSNNQLSSIENESIVGVSPWRGLFIVVASPKQVMVFDGALQKLNLEDQLNLKENEIKSISAQSRDKLWIATSAHLWRLNADKLEPYESIKSITQIRTFVGANEVVLQDDKGAFSLLKVTESGEVQQGSLPEGSPTFTTLVPGAADTLWGLSDKALYLRETNSEGQSRWTRYLLDGDTAETSSPIEAIALDATSGQIWAATATHIYNVTADKVFQTKRPEAIKEIKAIAATGGSALWISDGQALHQFVSQNTGNITYEGQVSVFMKENCWRCHEQVGPGRPLNTYDLVKNNIDSIIKATENGSMPADKKPLVGGDVNVLKNWVANEFAN